MPTTAAIAQWAVRASTQACKTPVYPEHQSSDNIGFFLACLLREQAQRDALHQLTREKSFPRKSQPLQHAVYHGITLHDEENQEVDQVRDSGRHAAIRARLHHLL